MNAADVIAYAYDAAIHCPDCAAERFNGHEDDLGIVDNEGNEVTPVFGSVEAPDGMYCDTCLVEILEPWR